jgi:hypothetical protein
MAALPEGVAEQRRQRDRAGMGLAKMLAPTEATEQEGPYHASA